MSYPYPSQAGPGQLNPNDSFMSYNRRLLQQHHGTQNDETKPHETQHQSHGAQQFQQYLLGSFSPEIPVNGLSDQGFLNSYNGTWYPPSTGFDEFGFLNRNTAPHAYNGPLGASNPAPSQHPAMTKGALPDTEDHRAAQELPQPLKSQTHPFWRTPVTYTLTNGEIKHGRVADLYQYDSNAREGISQYFEGVWQVRHNRSQEHNSGSPTTSQQQASGSLRPRSSQNKRPADTTNSRKRQRATAEDAMSEMKAAPAYVPDNDLDTPEKCRNYLAHAGSSNIQSLNIPHDDWKDVAQNRKQEFIGSIFNSLAHGYDPTPSTSFTLSDAVMEKYHTQQKELAAKVLARLQSPQQIRRAKALCSLLFDEAVYMHEFGVSQELYAGYEDSFAKNRQVDRKFRLNVEAICSVRLQMVVDLIKSNKLIALDVLEQKNFERIVRDPEFYIQEKFKYLTSNWTRQARTDKFSKQAADEQRDAGGNQELNGNIQTGTKRARRSPPAHCL